LLLELENVEVYYSAIHALRGITLEVPPGAIVALLGANGAGKSTTLKAISGLVPVFKGSITFEGQGTTDMSPERIVRLGIIHVPEGRRLFPELTVVENLKMGGYSYKDKAKKRESFSRVAEYFPRLRERWKQRAGTMSGGEQQMLAIGRALIAHPKLLVVDEPSLGLAPLLVRELMKIIQGLTQEGITILLVEQNAKMALSIASYGYVLEIGKISLQGKSSELLSDPKVKQSYLGR
jgi:branched-chain amino acid transport system ATP-binding protein